MRHKRAVGKLGRDYKHRKAILKGLALNLIKRERIVTTKTKAKALRSYIEKIITRAKVDNLHNRRINYREIRDTKALRKLFLSIAPRFTKRPGGYTRIYLLGARKGDVAEKAMIEFVEKAPSETSEKAEAPSKKKEDEVKQ